MNNFFHRANSSTFFLRTLPRIICSRCVISALGLAFERFFFVLNLQGRVAGGYEFWRGRVLSGGVGEQSGGWVNAQQGGGAKRGAFGKAAAGLGLAECLPAHAKRSGGAGCGGVEGGKSGKQVGYGVASVSRARRFVVVSPSWSRFSVPTYLRQRVIDGNGLHAPFSFSCLLYTSPSPRD